MVDRDALLAEATSPDRIRRARAEAAAFAGFRDRFGLDDSPDSVALYLTALAQSDLSGQAIRRHLHRLDLDRRLRGLAPWHSQPDVRALLRGLHASKPLGEGRGHYDPLYLHLVHAMIDACRTPSDDQRRALAATVLVERTNLPYTALAQLRWRDVRIGKRRATITSAIKTGRGVAITAVHHLDARPRDPRCPVAALRALRAVGGGEFVFGVDEKPIDIKRLKRLRRVPDPLAPSPAQARDRALILLGYGAGLRTQEAKSLCVGNIGRLDRGLVLAIPGRSRLTYVPSCPLDEYDPSTAWEAWVRLLDERGLGRPDGPAFRVTNFSVIFDKALADHGLGAIVHRRAEEAGLSGRFVWTSIRAGMMRTAVRNDARPYAIASQADLSSLTSVQRHEQRERLLGRQAIAGRLGL